MDFDVFKHLNKWELRLLVIAYIYVQTANFTFFLFFKRISDHSSIQVKPEVVILQGNGGQLTSPGYPSNYPNNVNDTWIIKTDDKRANVTFYIQEMDIEKTPGFPCDDYIEVIVTAS